MFVPKEKIAGHGTLQQGSTVGFAGQNLVVTRLGLISVQELNPHPFQNFYNQANPGPKP